MEKENVLEMEAKDWEANSIIFCLLFAQYTLNTANNNISSFYLLVDRPYWRRFLPSIFPCHVGGEQGKKTQYLSENTVYIRVLSGFDEPVFVFHLLLVLLVVIDQVEWA